jgi:hypothetical protein
MSRGKHGSRIGGVRRGNADSVRLSVGSAASELKTDVSINPNRARYPPCSRRSARQPPVDEPERVPDLFDDAFWFIVEHHGDLAHVAVDRFEDEPTTVVRITQADPVDLTIGNVKTEISRVEHEVEDASRGVRGTSLHEGRSQSISRCRRIDGAPYERLSSRAMTSPAGRRRSTTGRPNSFSRAPSSLPILGQETSQGTSDAAVHSAG